ncbi:DUF2312 domain-containing protein [Bradyrhizobium frederickii]|uniref:DUF2312 domain-containing protein n=1 Tax=Bradyrhizobium frederickii TaxID=2560054 RepID=A0A4Y9L852_9BRAD|nr:DUF2312 domain-containing protein [Bradyrhizobium frederickii]
MSAGAPRARGFDVRILNEIIKLRKEDKNARESLLDLYMRAMGWRRPRRSK